MSVVGGVVGTLVAVVLVVVLAAFGIDPSPIGGLLLGGGFALAGIAVGQDL